MIVKLTITKQHKNIMLSNDHTVAKLELDLFLLQHGACSVIELDGLLTAVVSSPNLVSLNQWLKIARIQDIEFGSEEEAQTIMGAILQFSNDILASLCNKTYAPLIELSKTKNLDQIIAEAKIWANGYTKGITTWDLNSNNKLYSNKDVFDIVINILSPIILLTIPDNELKPKYNSDESFTESRQTSVELLPDVAIVAYDFWLKRRKKLMDPITGSAIIKFGRNNLCSCGSGKKYCLH